MGGVYVSAVFRELRDAADAVWHSRDWTGEGHEATRLANALEAADIALGIGRPITSPERLVPSVPDRRCACFDGSGGGGPRWHLSDCPVSPCAPETAQRTSDAEAMRRATLAAHNPEAALAEMRERKCGERTVDLSHGITYHCEAAFGHSGNEHEATRADGSVYWWSVSSAKRTNEAEAKLSVKITSFGTPTIRTRAHDLLCSLGVESVITPENLAKVEAAIGGVVLDKAIVAETEQQDRDAAEALFVHLPWVAPEWAIIATANAMRDHRVRTSAKRSDYPDGAPDEGHGYTCGKAHAEGHKEGWNAAIDKCIEILAEDDVVHRQSTIAKNLRALAPSAPCSDSVEATRT